MVTYKWELILVGFSIHVEEFIVVIIQDMYIYTGQTDC